MIATWPALLINGSLGEELLLRFDAGREQRILILPAWFDEANKLRRFNVQLMRELDRRGADSFLPDFPGCNESLIPLKQQTIAAWRDCAQLAAEHVGATHVLAIRAGALLAPEGLAGWQYAPLSGAKVLRAMTRAQILADREAGREITSQELQERGRKDGLRLAGWHIGAEMLRELEQAEPSSREDLRLIEQKSLPGGGLWLRAEAGEDILQVKALADTMLGVQEDGV